MPEDTQYIVRPKLNPVPVRNGSMGAFLKQRIDEADPNKTALIDASTDRKLTYGQIQTQVNQIASALVELGVESGDVSMFYANDSIENAIGYLAMLYLGLTVSPSTPVNGPYETGQQLAGIGGKILFVSSKKLPIISQMMNDEKFGGRLIASLRLFIVLDDENITTNLEKFTKHPNSPQKVVHFQKLMQIGQGKVLQSVPHFSVNPETDHLLIVYTSGTTGLPKGAIHTHRTLMATFSGSTDILQGLTVALVYPFGHISGSVYIIMCLGSQMTGVLYSKYSDQLLFESVERYQIVMLPILPGFSLTLSQTDYTQKYDMSSVKLVTYGGMKFPREVLDTICSTYKVEIFEGYGATEFLGSVQNLPGEPIPYGSVGKPLPNIEMRIVDLETGENLPENRSGEICFRGPCCFVGYLNNPEATREAIDQDGWYHSGDVGYYDEEDRLFITDRIKELIKYKHWSIAPVEIEEFLHSHQAVLVACVIGVPHKTEGYHLRAFVRLTEGKTVTEQELIDIVKENMGYQKRLNGGVQFVDDIPRTIIGKVDRENFKNLVKNELLTEPAKLQEE